MLVIVNAPLPTLSTNIPCADPVTALTVIVRVVPLVEVLLTKIPCLPAPEPVTVLEALTEIVPVEVFSAIIP